MLLQVTVDRITVCQLMQQPVDDTLLPTFVGKLNSIIICRAFNPLSSYKSIVRRLCSLLNTITYKHRVTSSSRRHFSRCLKANKAIKSKGIRTLYCHNSFESVLMLLAKIIKISSCLAKLQPTKFAAFLRHSGQQCDCISVIGSCVVKYF